MKWNRNIGVAGLIVLSSVASLGASKPYVGSSFGEVWEQVKSDPYRNPQNEVSFYSLFGWGVDKIARAANRTLNDHSDLLPSFKKLAHPNGICLAGTWEVNVENPYTGYFKKGSLGYIVARASTALSNTKRGRTRAFGFAGKVFPAESMDEIVRTGNFFTAEDLGGTNAKHFTDVELTNEPPVSKTFEVFKYLSYGLKLASTFGNADVNPGVRPLHEISELGLHPNADPVTPGWMKIQAQQGQSVDEIDFRDELDISNYHGELVFNVFVSSQESDAESKRWMKIGVIRFTDSVVSDSCDHRLHFHHPQIR